MMSKIVSYAKIIHAAIWGETEVCWRHQAAALYSVRRDGTAVLCCPRVGHLEACQLQSLVFGLFVSVRFHSTLKDNSNLSSARSLKMLKLTAQTFFILRSRLPSMVRRFVHYYISAVFDLAAVRNFVLLLTIWHLRIRVSLMFDNMNNVVWVHVEGLNPRLWKKLSRSNCKIWRLKSLCMKASNNTLLLDCLNNLGKTFRTKFSASHAPFKSNNTWRILFNKG